ncbi:MAG: glycosyltransferase family 2 protein [Chloroflexota bacterium]|nr:MAG: glycosyltransferase family 2 protein [Chloroflexota bacterium]
MIDLSIVIVNWNVRDLLRRCLHSIPNLQSSPSGEVIVVDNASTDGSVEMVRAEFPGVHLIANADNRGFPAANNQGIAVAQGRYVLLLNPDTEVVGDALATMVAFADAHPDVGIVGPQLLNPDGSVQSSRRRFPTLATAFFESTWLQGYAPRRLLERYYVLDRPDDAVQDVDWVTGAAVMARREAIEQVGLLDEGFFMYSEELDWCRRFREAGWRVVYLPAAQIVHHVGKSSEQVVAARHIHFQTSKVRYFRKYHGSPAAEALRLFLLGNYVWQLGLEGAKWLLGHKRTLRAQRIAAYRQVLRSGLRGTR